MLAQILTCLNLVISPVPGGISVNCAPIPTPAPIVTPVPIPTVPPTPAPTIAPTPSPTTAAQAAQACAASIVNGAPLPPCVSTTLFPGGIYRRMIPPTAQADPNSSRMIAAYFGPRGSANDVVGGLMFHNGAAQATYSYGRPLYVAKASDPVVTIHCSVYCVQGSAVGIHLPARAIPEGGSDSHLAIYQPTGELIDLWGVSGSPPWTNGETISAGTVAFSSIDGDAYSSADILPGWMKNAITAGGQVTPNGIITLTELMSGTITHELYGTITCTASTWNWPATQTARVCADGRTSIPNGSLLRYRPNADAIAQSSMSTESKIIALAMHNFGIRIGDTGGSSGLSIQVENQASFWSYGSGIDPFIAYASSHGWNHIKNTSANPPVDRYVHILNDLDLPDNLEVLYPGS